MDGQPVLLDIAMAMAFLIPLAQGDGLALHPARVGELGGVGDPVGGGGFHGCGAFWGLGLA